MNSRACSDIVPTSCFNTLGTRSISFALAALVLCISASCKSSPTTEGDPGIGRGSGAATGSNAATLDNPAVAAEIEKKYVIGPAAARDLNYRIDWQYIGAGDKLRLLTVQGDSVFALDNRNFLTRIKIQGGSRLWQISVADPIEEIIGLNFLGDHVYLTSGGSMVVLDAGTGSQIGKTRLSKIANTMPSPMGAFLIYGSRDGQIVWHSLVTNYEWKSYQVAHSIEVQPLLVDGYIVTVGSEGTVAVLNAAYVTQYWSKQLLNSIVAAPAVGGGKVFVPGLDQYLWAFDINTGKTLWKVLTESPLTESPTLIGDRIYQQIPKEGLECFNADPATMSGQVFWKSPSVKGNALFQHQDSLFVWDRASNTMSVIEPKHGSVARTSTLPEVRRLVVAGQNHDELYAASDDGRIVHLMPRN